MAVILLVQREVAKAEVGGKVEDPLAGRDERGGVFGGDAVRQGQEPDVHVGLRAFLGRGSGKEQRRVHDAAEARDLVGHGLAGQGAGTDGREPDPRVAGQYADELLPGVTGGADDADLGQVLGHGWEVWWCGMTKRWLDTANWATKRPRDAGAFGVSCLFAD